MNLLSNEEKMIIYEMGFDLFYTSNLYSDLVSNNKISNIQTGKLKVEWTERNKEFTDIIEVF